MKNNKCKTQKSDDNNVFQIGSLTFESKEFLGTFEAAGFLDMAVGTLRNYTSNGKIPVYKIGRKNLYRKDELRDLLKSNRLGGSNGN